MTEAKKTTETKTEAKVEDDKKQTPQQIAPEVTDNADNVVAKRAGITEGEVKALRDDAGVNQLAGHEADILAWSLTPAGEAFAKSEKDRNDAEKDYEKGVKATVNKDGLSEAEAAYAKAVSGK